MVILQFLKFWNTLFIHHDHLPIENGIMWNVLQLATNLLELEVVRNAVPGVNTYFSLIDVGQQPVSVPFQLVYPSRLAEHRMGPGGQHGPNHLMDIRHRLVFIGLLFQQMLSIIVKLSSITILDRKSTRLNSSHVKIS